MALLQASEPITLEMMKGANVEEVLAKYFGLSLIKSEVKVVKEAVEKQNEVAVHNAIKKIISRHTRSR